MADLPQIRGTSNESYQMRDYLTEQLMPWLQKGARGMGPAWNYPYGEKSTDEQKKPTDELMIQLLKSLFGGSDFDLYGKFPMTDPANVPTPTPAPTPTQPPAPWNGGLPGRPDINDPTIFNP